MRDNLREWLGFFRAEAHVLLREPALLFRQAANQPDTTDPARVAARRWAAGGEKRPWLRWVNKPQSASACLLTLGGVGTTLHSCAFSPDGLRVAAMGEDGTLRIWNAESGVELAAVGNHRGRGARWEFSPDGTRIASACHSSVLLLDPVSGAVLGELPGHTEQVTDLAFSPDGLRLVSASGSTLTLWNARTAELIARLTGHQRTITCCAFSPRRHPDRLGRVKRRPPPLGRPHREAARRAARTLQGILSACFLP